MAEEESLPPQTTLDVKDLVQSYTGTLPLSSWLKIAVKEPTRRITTTLKIQDTFVEYMVETKIHDKSKVFRDWLEADQDAESFPEVLTVWRRYSEFDLLKDYLLVTYPFIVVPPLPEKRTNGAWQAAVVDKTDPEFLERRRIGLEQFWKRLVEIPEVSNDSIVLEFLKAENWKELVGASNYQAKADSRIRALSVGYRIKHPSEVFEAIKKYANELETHISNVLKVRARTAEHLYGLHKIHANYGREFSDWSAIERPDVAEGLQKMGHYIDSFAQDIDVSVESEEDFADELKEYHGFCESLRHICKKQELLQLELEQAEDALESKKTERDNLCQGKTGLFGEWKRKMFGGGTPEQKEEKLKTLDEQIVEAEERLHSLKEGMGTFETKALANIHQFNKQKVHDIQDILVNFIILSIDRCKKSRATWANIKAACDAI